MAKSIIEILQKFNPNSIIDLFSIFQYCLGSVPALLTNILKLFQLNFGLPGQFGGFQTLRWMF